MNGSSRKAQVCSRTGPNFLFWKTWIWEVMQVDGTFLVCCQTTKRNRDHVGVRRVAKLTKANVWLYLFGVITAVALLPWSHWVVTFFFLSRCWIGPQGHSGPGSHFHPVKIVKHQGDPGGGYLEGFGSVFPWSAARMQFCAHGKTPWPYDNIF